MLAPSSSSSSVEGDRTVLGGRDSRGCHAPPPAAAASLSMSSAAPDVVDSRPLPVPCPMSGTSPSSPELSQQNHQRLFLPDPPAASSGSSSGFSSCRYRPISPVATVSSMVASTQEPSASAPASGRGSAGLSWSGAAGVGSSGDPVQTLEPAGDPQSGSSPGAGLAHAADQAVPLLSRYDPYHGTTCFVHHPFTQRPLSGEDARESLRKGITQGMSQLTWRLNYQDFAPNIQGLEDSTLRSSDTFSDLVDRANTWLEQNVQYRVRNCETVTWWTTEPIHVGDTEAVMLDQVAHASNLDDTIYLIGLRLWLIYKKEQEPLQRLHMRDFHPTERESVAHLVRKVNALLAETPSPGSVLTLETVTSPDLKGRDTGATLWRESQCKQHTLFIRIFYTEGPSQQETIGIRDFCPTVTPSGSDTFASLVKKAKRWINDERTVRVTNLRSIYVTRDNDRPSESADQTTHQYFKFDVHQYFNLLRVFYVRRVASTPASYHVINYVTFTPVQLLPGESTEVDYEKMRQTMVRVIAWLKAAGAEVLCCETVVTPLCAHVPSQTLPEITYWTPTIAANHINYANLKKYLTHIRVFLEGDYREPDPRFLPPLPASLTSALHATLLERERRHYRRRRKRRKRRRSIMIVVSAVILTVIIGIIIVDQSMNFFGL